MAQETAVQAVTRKGNLSSFAERGFRTVDKAGVLSDLTRNGLDPDSALVAARDAVESVGGFVTNADRNAGLEGNRASWRYIYEVWMVPDNVSDSRAA